MNDSKTIFEKKLNQIRTDEWNEILKGIKDCLKLRISGWKLNLKNVPANN